MNDKKSLEEPLNPSESNHHEPGIPDSISIEPGNNGHPPLNRKTSSKVNIPLNPTVENSHKLSRKNSSNFSVCVQDGNQRSFDCYNLS